MFCSKCGAKAIEGTVFCEKCGAKLGNDAGSTMAKRSVQTDMRGVTELMVSEASNAMEKGMPETQNTFETVSAGDIYNLIQKSAPNCPGIKKIDFWQKHGITKLIGKKNQYYIGFSRGEYRLTVYPAFLFSVPRIILLFAYCFILSLLFAELDFEEMYFLPGWLLLIGGVSGAIVSSVICIKEKKQVVHFIKEALSNAVCVKASVAHIIEPIPMMLNSHLMFLGLPLHVASIIEPIVCVVAALAGVLVLMTGSGVLDDIGNSRYNESVYNTYNDKTETNQYMPLSDAENISLSSVYTNEGEGFSFMYPEDWKVVNKSDALGYVEYSDVSGTLANIIVVKEVDDGSYFIATELDFEEAYSLAEGLSDVKVMDLSDIVLDGHPARKLTFATNNDNGIRIIEIQYFYNRDYYVYSVMCAVEETNYDSYGPKFNAIMDSYTITAQEQQKEWGDSTGGNSSYNEIEAYEISGAYAGIWENSTASISMYSSGEEDGAVGNISLFLDSRMSVYGGLFIEGLLMRRDVNLFCVQYEDVDILMNVGKNNAGDIMIALYIDEEFVESFTMTEQYIS